jgi:mannose/cellobiose epimerase-like protein (N-acyl-D-glucosamine 2-epimerase family)
MNPPPQNHDDNVVELTARKKSEPDQPVYSFAKTGDAQAKKRGDASLHDDARVKEAMRLAEAFLAIEDATARSSLIALAERLVSYDWVRNVK